MKKLFFLLLVSIIAACSHPIEIVGEGDVWATGGRTCTLEDYNDGLDNCSKNYVTGAYQETYYAEPREGWQFDRWGNYCADAVDNSCSFDISGEAVRQAWGQAVPPLQAVFTLIPPPDADGDGLPDNEDPCPANPNNPCALIPAADILTVDGKEWAQPDLFTSLSWNDIDAVCPSGVCGSSATLKGYDLSGWAWASVDDVNALFSVYTAPVQLGPGPDVHSEIGSQWAPAFFADGWRPTQGVEDWRTVYCWASTLSPSLPLEQEAYIVSLADYVDSDHNDYANTLYPETVLHISPWRGAYFYR